MNVFLYTHESLCIYICNVIQIDTFIFLLYKHKILGVIKIQLKTFEAVKFYLQKILQ